MTGFYDYEKFREEICYEELEVGQYFPAFRYRLASEHVELYMRSVEETSAIYSGSAACGLGVDEGLAPSLAALNYGFFYSAMGRRPPTGYINSAVEFEFMRLIPADADLKMIVSVNQKYVKRGRKYIVFKLDVHNERNELLATAKVDCIFPK